VRTAALRCVSQDCFAVVCGRGAVLPPRNLQQDFVLLRAEVADAAAAAAAAAAMLPPRELARCSDEGPLLLLAVNPEVADEQGCWNDACAHRSARSRPGAVLKSICSGNQQLAHMLLIGKCFMRLHCSIPDTPQRAKSCE
jgi:hypothetical protein